MQPPEGPPIWMALNFLPPGMPPPMSKIIWPNGVLSGTSMRPELFILPTRQKVLVPLHWSEPALLHHCAPWWMMRGTFDQLSTLFRVVGLSNNPLLAGKGGR